MQLHLGAANFKLTVTPAGTDTIDGAANLVIKTNDTAYSLIDVTAGKWEIF